MNVTEHRYIWLSPCVRVGVAVCGGCLGGDNSVWMVEGAGSAAHQH